jgi:hypothetical protein
MDWMVLSNQAVALFIQFLPYLQEAGKETAKEIAGDAWLKTKQMYTFIKSKFSKSSEKKQLLVLFEKNPELFKEALAKALTTLAETDDNFAKLLKASVGSFNHNQVAQTATGNQNIQVANGSVTINSSPFEFGNSNKAKK